MENIFVSKRSELNSELYHSMRVIYKTEDSQINFLDSIIGKKIFTDILSLHYSIKYSGEFEVCSLDGRNSAESISQYEHYLVPSINSDLQRELDNYKKYQIELKKYKLRLKLGKAINEPVIPNVTVLFNDSSALKSKCNYLLNFYQYIILAPVFGNYGSHFIFLSKNKNLKEIISALLVKVGYSNSIHFVESDNELPAY